VLKRTLPITLLLALACAPGAAASPQAHSAAQQRAEASLEEAEQLVDGHGVRTGHELTLALRDLSTRLRHLRGDDRRKAIALLSRPTDADAPADERYTVPEAPPVCDPNFCIHHVDSTADAATPAQVALALLEANAVRLFANGTLGWRDPPNDPDEQVDIYLKELGDQSLFGFAATDPGQNQQSQHSYLVIDDDFDPAQYGGADALESLRITLAHEYTHVLQYGYDVLADGWHYESSAVWMEQRMYPVIKDWLRFMNDGSRGGGWRSLTELPLTYFEPNPDSPGSLDPRTAKVYGDAVWNQFLSAKYGAAGDALQRGTWEESSGIERPSTAAFDTAIRNAGGPGISSDFGEFSAAVAEWRALDSPFPAAADLPDVERRGNLAVNGAGITAVMDHLTFALYDVPAASGPVRLAVSFPEGTSAAIALVARSGAVDGGEVTTELLQLPNGGAGGVTIDDPSAVYDSGGRVTAVLVNSDASHGQWDDDRGDWEWTRDEQLVTARVTSDTGGPAVTAFRPSRAARRVSPRRAIAATFSEPVTGVSEETFLVRGPGGRRVRGSIKYTGSTRTATFTPAKPLSDTSRYTVHLAGSIVDAGANRLAPTDWSFTTVRRGPRATLRGFRLRSRDADRLDFRAVLRQDGRVVARRRGRIQPGTTRRLRIAGGEAGAAQLVVSLTDPQGNRKRLTRTLQLST
jgi:hypothetical protein